MMKQGLNTIHFLRCYIIICVLSFGVPINLLASESGVPLANAEAKRNCPASAEESNVPGFGVWYKTTPSQPIDQPISKRSFKIAKAAALRHKARLKAVYARGDGSYSFRYKAYMPDCVSKLIWQEILKQDPTALQAANIDLYHLS